MTRRTLIRYALLVLLAFAAAGCAQVTRRPGCVRLGPGSMCLLPPSALPPISGQRMLTLRHGATREDLVSYLQVNAGTLRLDNFTLLGLPAFTIIYDGHRLTLDPPDAKMDAGRVVALLELALAPPAALAPRLQGLRLIADGRGQRRLLAHGRTLATIDRRGDRLEQASFTIRVPAAGIDMTLKPLQDAP